MAVSQNLSVVNVLNSENITDNTSKIRITWTSTQTDSSYNDYTRTAYYWITTPDGVETKYSVSYTLPRNSTKTILGVVVTVKHKDDGSGTVRVRTWMDTGISAGVVELDQRLNLQTIPMASEITSAKDVTIGKACSVVWTPKSASFRYKLKFSLGGWNYTTDAIHPNKTSAYTYSGYEIPLKAAEQLPNAKTGKMTVTLYTYAKKDATDPIGDADTATFTVTVPDNSITQPAVSMALSPVSSLPDAFDGLYIQGKTKVQATISAEGKHKATIKKYGLQVDSDSYGPGTSNILTSDYLPNYGTVYVYGAAEDSRGYSNIDTKSINVIAYSNPKILPVSGEKNVVAARCDKDGNPSDSGTYLIIKAKRSYSPVKADGVQKNFCQIRFRYKVDGGSYPDKWTTILAANSLNSDEITTGALLNGALSAKSTYLVQVQAIDDIGEKTTTTITIPTDKVYCHRDGARRSFAFGGYVEDDNTFSIAEDITFKAKGPIEAQGGGNIDTLVLGIQITATADAKVSLNNYKTPGNYYSPNADNSQYITDCPNTEGGFGMTVRQLQTTGYIRQELFYGRTTWIRHWNGEEWSEWWRYQTTTVPETASVDYVIETGSSGGWTYKKWKGGTYEMFGTFTVTPTESTLNSSLYRTNNMTIAVPFAIKSAYLSGSAVGYYWITNGGISGNSAITLRLMSDKTFSTTAAIEVRLTVVGTYA